MRPARPGGGASGRGDDAVASVEGEETTREEEERVDPVWVF